MVKVVDAVFTLNQLFGRCAKSEIANPIVSSISDATLQFIIETAIECHLEPVFMLPCHQFITGQTTGNDMPQY
jgi:hypothetical protein